MYCLSRPESYLKLVPSRDQDDKNTKSKGRHMIYMVDTVYKLYSMIYRIYNMNQVFIFTLSIIKTDNFG